MKGMKEACFSVRQNEIQCRLEWCSGNESKLQSFDFQERFQIRFSDYSHICFLHSLFSGGSCPNFYYEENKDATPSNAVTKCTEKNGGGYILARFETAADFTEYLRGDDGNSKWFALRKKHPFTYRKDGSTNYDSYAQVLPNVEWISGDPVVKNFFTEFGKKNGEFKVENYDSRCFMIKKDGSKPLVEDKPCKDTSKYVCYKPCNNGKLCFFLDFTAEF